MQSYITAVGVNNALNKKKIKLFDEKEQKKITPEDKQKELDYLKNKFNRSSL